MPGRVDAAAARTYSQTNSQSIATLDGSLRAYRGSWAKSRFDRARRAVRTVVSIVLGMPANLGAKRVTRREQPHVSLEGTKKGLKT